MLLSLLSGLCTTALVIMIALGRAAAQADADQQRHLREPS